MLTAQYGYGLRSEHEIERVKQRVGPLLADASMTG
jgi:hypothetical protein